MSETTPISSGDGASSTGWTRRQGATKNDRSVLLGARIRDAWLNQSVSLLSVRLTGALADGLRALVEAAKASSEKNLPIIRLRAALMAELDGVVRLDRDLGLKAGTNPALELRWVATGDPADADAEVGQVKEQVVRILQRWRLDVVNAWVKRNELGTPADALRACITPENLEVRVRSQPLAEVGPDGQIHKPEFDLIAKHLAERLDGEELFPGMGPCTLIADAASTDGSVELTTWPKKVNVAGRDSVFSMVTRLSVLTWPTRKGLHLKVTPVKRVWAPKVPGRKPNAPASVRCFVFGPGKPVLPAAIRRGKEGWEFGDEYLQYRFESANALPTTLSEAVDNLLPQENSWWVGLPELTTLFDRVQQRTVFESDEVDLFEMIVSLLPDALDKEVPYRVLKLNRAMSQAKSEVARLQVVDVTAEPALAGASLAEEQARVDPDEADEETNEAVDATTHRERLERHRSANQQALDRIHGTKKPSLWVFVDGEDERHLIERSARALFGNSLRLEFSTLPQGVHGLQESLDLPKEKGIRRFDARVGRWEATAQEIARRTDGARHVLICAPKEIGRKAEDPVNYFAGLHAMSRYAQANVHHLLPLEEDYKTKKPDIQHFIHRAQSALLDVFLAHSGMVFGVDTFVEACLGASMPRAIYGIQVIRSQARAYTAELPANLILFTRLDVGTGVTSVRFVVRNGTQTKSTDWQPLNEGLQWLGSQRNLRGDEPWLRDNFAEETRKVLGMIGEDDPHAVVLIDWLTVAALWKDIADASLSSSTTRRVMLDGVDFARAYRQMTILRLRSDRNATMLMRWVRNTTFEEWRVEGPRVPTHQTSEEHYATTFKTVVELDASQGSRLYPHYLMVMGYRNTVQTKRGLSCYRSMPAMVKNKANGLFERGQLRIASDNAALPSGLEMTVLQHPEGVQPDSLARLVMGLRLGYAHYDDWTALPAPLFFVAKVRDYIVRYPELDDSLDERRPAGSDSSDGGEDAAAEVGPAAQLRNELVAEVLEELPELAVAAEAERVQTELQAVEVTADYAAPSAEAEESESQADDELPESLPHPVLNRAFQAALAAPELYSKRSGLDGRKLYERMILGAARVRVELPTFVTRDTVLRKDDWPADHRSIGKFWRRQRSFGVPVKTGSAAPSVSSFPDWVMKRLTVPQSLWTLDIPGVIPTQSPLFNQAYVAHGNFARALAREADEENAEQTRNDFWEDLPDLVAWLCDKKSDEDLGWVLCRMAHYPYKDVVPRAIEAIDPDALGPNAAAALQYMTSCFEVCRKALDEFSGPEHKVGAYFIPSPLGVMADMLQATQPSGVPEPPTIKLPLQEAKAVSTLSQTPTLLKTPVGQTVAVLSPAAAPQSAPLPSRSPRWPIPGEPDFDESFDACSNALEDLKRQHEQVLAALAEAQRLEREQAACATARQAAISAKLAQLDKSATEFVALLTPHLPHLSVGAWQTHEAAKVFGTAADIGQLDALESQLKTLSISLDAALRANKALIDIDEGRFDGADKLGPTERRRRKAELLPAAARQLVDAEAQLKKALGQCPLLTSAESAEVAPGYSRGVDDGNSEQANSDSTPPAIEAPSAAPVEPEPPQRLDTVISVSVVSERAQAPDAIAIPLQPMAQPEPLEEDRVADVGEPATDDIGLTASIAEPFDLSEPARGALLVCIRSGRWALAEAAANTFSQVNLDWTAKLWEVAVRGLHSARKRQSIDITTLDSLGEWLSGQAADHGTANTFVDHLGALGAALVPILLEGRDTRIRWTAIQYLKPRMQQHPELYRLLDRLESLDSIQLDITPETLAAARVGLHQALQDSIRRFRERAANWPSDPVLTTNWSATDYIEMHQAMFAEKSASSDDRRYAVGGCLAAIAKGSDDRARRLWAEVQKQADKGLASISDIRKRIGRRKPIEGVGRDCLVDNLKATASFIADFFAQLDRQQDSKRNSLPPKHEQFLQGLYRELQDAKKYVEDLAMGDGPQAIHRAIALEAIEQALRLMDQSAAPSVLTDEDQLLLLDHPMGRDLLPSLEWRLPDDPSTVVSVGDAVTLIESLTHVAGLAEDTDIQKLLVSAAASHRAAERLLPARLIEQRLAKSPRGQAPVATENDAAQREARTRLAADLQDAKQRVTNAMSLNALLQTEASRMLKLIDSLTRANGVQEIGTPANVTGLYPDYPHARAVLQQLVLKPLESKIEQSRNQIELDVNELLSERKQRNLEPSELRQFEQKASRILDRLRQGTALSVRVARNEFLLLREDKLPLLKFDEKTPALAFSEFRDAVHKLTSGHRVLDGLHGILTGTIKPNVDGLDLIGMLSADERKEAADFIDEWVCLFNAQARADINRPLEAFFRAADVPQSPTVTNPTERRFFFSEKPFAGLSGSLGEVFIPPALGSDATHIDGIIIPTSATFVQLQQAVAQIRSATPTFVLTHQRLSLQQRAQLGQDAPVLVVDDELVAYLALNPATRLAKLLEVCLLSCRTNPYADYGQRPVPPEMFFGRKEELRKLHEVPSAAVLYGGRRLGKSSLLNQILEDSRASVHLVLGEMGTGEMAVYVNIDSKSDPASFSQDYLLFSWKAIYKALLGSSFLKASRGDLKTAHEIREYIQGEIVGGRVATNACYLLIDEADEVMREDLQKDTPFLTSLQALSDAVMGKCRVRYVIAGLHNLSRMTTASNSALGKATTIALQPFSSATDIQNGIDLITKPLGALGFHFGKGDENLPMRIMAVCNFYPAFIQVYCRSLVNRLYNNRSSKDLPTAIKATDLDAVERDPDFLRDIQEKFGLNLNLDKRYKAIALILAEHSYAEPTGGFTGLTATDIRDHCVAYAPEHFKTTAPGAYEALLDEMEKLTILERNRSRYQLRTPDIATMLGDKDQVARLLEELAREKPTEDRSRGEVRLRVRQAQNTATLPLPSAWLRNYLHGDKGDLVVVVGNNLSGIGAFDRLRGAWDVGQEEATIEGITFKGPEDARSWISRERRKPGAQKQKTRIVAVLPRCWVPQQLDSYASVARDQADSSSRTVTTTTRPLLVANPDQALQLAYRASEAPRSSLPSNLVLVPAMGWSDDAVYFWLNDLENQFVRDNGPARKALLDASFGFGDELERMCSRALTVDEALRQPDEACKRLAASLDGFYDELGMPASLSGDNLRRLEGLLDMIHGGNSQETDDEFLSDLSVPRAHFLFAKWMGLIQVSAAGTWQVPPLYLELIKARSVEAV